MENNITNLFKSINYMNKKTLLPTFDDYIIFEDGNFILQDAFKTYVLNFDVLKDKGSYFISKSDFIKIKTKNAKYFLEEISKDGMVVKIVTKNDESTAVVPVISRSINHLNLIDQSFTYTNSIDVNGINLKTILNGFKDDITFKFADGLVMVAMGEYSPFINFNAEFGELCELIVNSSDDSIAQTVGENIVDAIGQFGLVKKNSTLNIKFNDKSFALNNNNLTIFIASNKI